MPSKEEIDKRMLELQYKHARDSKEPRLLDSLIAELFLRIERLEALIDA